MHAPSGCHKETCAEKKMKRSMFFLCCATDSATPGHAWSRREPPPGPEVNRESIQRRRGSTAERSRGRIIRIVLLGNPENKMKYLQVANASSRRRLRRASSISSNVSTVFGDARLIFNEVPARDLDNPNASSDFEDFLAHADAAVIVNDVINDSLWPDTAERWRLRLTNLKKNLPFALLLVIPNQTFLERDPLFRQTLTDNAEAFSYEKSDFVGWFLTASSPHSQTGPQHNEQKEEGSSDSTSEASLSDQQQNGRKANGATDCLGSLVSAVRASTAVAAALAAP